MHLGFFQCKSKMRVGKSGRIPQSAEARYQSKEKCVGIKGAGLTHMKGNYGPDASQEGLHDAFNILSHGLDAPLVQEMMEEVRQRKWNLMGEKEKKYTKKVANVKLTKEELAPIIKAGTIRQNETKDGSRSVLDISWSPPKSFSIMHAMSKDDELKARMEQALQESVEETLEDMQKYAMRRSSNSLIFDENGTRKLDKDGAAVREYDTVGTGNFIYSSFMHYESRPVKMEITEQLRADLESKGIKTTEHDGQIYLVKEVKKYNEDERRMETTKEETLYVRDMQLHMHTPISNLTYDPNAIDEKSGEKGKWYALENSEMLKRIPYFQAVASQRLAKKLEKMGFEVQRDGASWEIGWFTGNEGREVIDRFSKRTDEVYRYASDLDMRDPLQRKEMNNRIRRGKEEGITDKKDLQSIWETQINEYEQAKIEDELHSRDNNELYQDQPGSEYYNFKNKDHHKLTAEDCIRHAISVASTNTDVLKTMNIRSKAIIHGVTMDPEEIDAAFKAMVESGEIILHPNVDANDPEPEYFTTKALLSEAKKLVNIAQRLKRDTSSPTIGKQCSDARGNVEFEASKFGILDYTDDQKGVLDAVLKTPGKISFIEGNAGTGKTTVGLQIKRAVEMSGRRFFSVTVATRAREVLNRDGYGKYMLVDKDNQMVMQEDNVTGKMKPKFVERAEAQEYYTNEYGGTENIPREIKNSLKAGITQEPQTLSKLLTNWDKYTRNKARQTDKHASEQGKEESLTEMKAIKKKMEGGVLFVDEAGQLGTEQALKLLAMAEEFNMQLILVGDRKQHKSVMRGSVLNMLTKEAGIEPYALTDIRRQSGPLKEIMEHLGDGEWPIGLNKLKNIGGIVEIEPEEAKIEKGKKKKKTSPYVKPSPKNIAQLEERFASDIVQHMQYEDPTIVITEHLDGRRIDELVRTKLKALKGTGAGFTLDDDKKMEFEYLARNDKINSAASKTVASNYKVGMQLQFMNAIPGADTCSGEYKDKRTKETITIGRGQVIRGTVAKVLAVNKDQTLTLECRDAKGTYYRIMKVPTDLEKAGRIVVNTLEKTEICPNDRILLTQNIMVGKDTTDRTNQKNNGTTYTVKDVRMEGGHKVLVVDSGNGEEFVLSPETVPTHANFSRQFYNTSFGVQGSTADKGAAMVYFRTSNPKKETVGNFYVDASRACGEGKMDAHGKNTSLLVYTDNFEAMKAQGKSMADKPDSALAFEEKSAKLSKEPEEVSSDEHIGMMWNRLKYHPEELAAEIKGYNITDLRHLRALFEQDLENAGGMPDFRKRRPNKARHPDNLLPAMRVIDERIAVLTRRNGHETEVAVDQYRGGAQEPERPGV